MSTALRDYGVVLYWAVYLLLLMLPRILYRKEHVFEREDIFRGFPQHRRILDLWPRISSALTILFLLLIFAMWFSAGYARSTTIHAIGLAYGTMLVLDAVFAWISGVRPLPGLRQRYAVPTDDPWRPMLQFTLSILYLAVPIAFLILR
jgi:hypothetical protein